MKSLSTFLLFFALLGATLAPAQTAPNPNLVKKVRHELVMLPHYGVFDNLAYEVAGDGTVTLYGQVLRAFLVKDAERAVQHVKGVTKVINHIEALPVSAFDDQIRLDTYRIIYTDPVLSRYGLPHPSSIHIIVKNGHLTLEGVVDSKMDSQVAYMRASSVHNVFSVTNHLTIASGK